MTDERMEVEWILFDPKRNDKKINVEYPLISIKRGPFRTIKFNDFRKSHLIYSYLCWSCRVVYDCVRLLALYRISHIWIGLNRPTPFQKIIYGLYHIRIGEKINWQQFPSPLEYLHILTPFWISCAARLAVCLLEDWPLSLLVHNLISSIASHFIDDE